MTKIALNVRPVILPKFISEKPVETGYAIFVNIHGKFRKRSKKLPKKEYL